MVLWTPKDKSDEGISKYPKGSERVTERFAWRLRREYKYSTGNDFYGVVFWLEKYIKVERQIGISIIAWHHIATKRYKNYIFDKLQG